MPTYRVCAWLTKPQGQKDTLPFSIRVADIDGLRKALVRRDTDARVFDIEHPSTGRILGHFIIEKDAYIWENANSAYPIDPKTGKIGKRRY